MTTRTRTRRVAIVPDPKTVKLLETGNVCVCVFFLLFLPFSGE